MKKLLTLATLCAVSAISFTTSAFSQTTTSAPYKPQVDAIIKACLPLPGPGPAPAPLTSQQQMVIKARAVPCVQKALITIQVALDLQFRTNMDFQIQKLIPAQEKLAELLAQIPQQTSPVSTPIPPELDKKIKNARYNLDKVKSEFKNLLTALSVIRNDETRMIQHITYL